MKQNSRFWKAAGPAAAVISAAALIAGGIAGSVTGTAGAKDVPADAITATGSAPGMNGDVTVQVVADADGIYKVQVTDEKETEGIGSVAVDKLPQRIYEAQSTDVDGISGATVTSNAIRQAVLSALTDSGIDPAGFTAKRAEVPSEPDRDYHADVVVVGAGGAGMTAAIEARDAGASVIVLESMPMAGGNSIRATGGMNAAKTVYQDENDFDEAAGVEKTLQTAADSFADNGTITGLAAAVKQQWDAYQSDPKGYFDSVELFELDTMIGGKGINDPELVKTLAENSADAIDWLDSIGATMHSVSSFGGASVKRIHRPVDGQGKTVSVGAYMIPILESNVASRNIQIYYNTTAKSFLTDAGGAVTGVAATGSSGNTINVHAGAVVLATGGFGANHEMIEKYRPELKGFMSTNAAGARGQGLEMASAVGAAMVDLDQIQVHPTVQVDTAALITEGLRGDGAILVNQNGERFIDEVGTRDVVSGAEIAQPGSAGWLIIDQKMADASNVIQGYISKGYTVTGNTPEDLADAMGVPADAFAKTLDTWNGYVASGSDPDFGRTSFASPLDTAPYYAIHVTAAIHHTMGGVKINSDTQVLREDGSVIPGLFAAGEVTGGVHGANRLGGNAVADFTIFGRIAGQQAAAYVK